MDSYLYVLKFVMLSDRFKERQQRCILLLLVGYENVWGFSDLFQNKPFIVSSLFYCVTGYTPVQC